MIHLLRKTNIQGTFSYVRRKEPDSAGDVFFVCIEQHNVSASDTDIKPVELEHFNQVLVVMGDYFVKVLKLIKFFTIVMISSFVNTFC